MNERIQQLEKQSYTEVMHEMGGTYMAFDKEKFAQLIVRECLQVCMNEGASYEEKAAGAYQSNLYVNAIKKHFGVK
jgi:hypothetical protein